MPTILRTPAPYPSTILSLQPSEQFRTPRGTLVQTVTVSPTAPLLLLSGPAANPLLPGSRRLRTESLRSLADPALTKAPAPVRQAVSQALAAYQIPAPPGYTPPVPSLTPAPRAPSAAAPYTGRHRAS